MGESWAERVGGKARKGDVKSSLSCDYGFPLPPSAFVQPSSRVPRAERNGPPSTPLNLLGKVMGTKTMSFNRRNGGRTGGEARSADQGGMVEEETLIAKTSLLCSSLLRDAEL